MPKIQIPKYICNNNNNNKDAGASRHAKFPFSWIQTICIVHFSFSCQILSSEEQEQLENKKHGPGEQKEILMALRTVSNSF